MDSLWGILRAMTKKEIADVLKPYNDDIKRHMGALEEHFADGVKAIGEKVDFLHEKMDKRFGQADGRFDRIEKRLDSHTEMIGKIMIQLEEIKGELKQKVDYRDFAKLEKRVAQLEVVAVR